MVSVIGTFVSNDSILYDTYSSSNCSGDCSWISFDESCVLPIMYSLQVYKGFDSLK